MVPGRECFPYDADANGGDVRGELFCFPFAGAGAHVFTRWPSISDTLRVRPVELPGKSTRLIEKPFTDLVSCARYCADAIQKYRADVPLGLLGHSAGAAVALATAGVLERRGCAARCLIVCSALPPHENARWAALQPTSAEPGLPETPGVPPELRSLMSRAFDADLAMSTQEIDGLRLQQTEVVLIAGEDETELRNLATTWCDVAPGGSFRIVLVPGGHFAINETGYWDRISPAIRAAMDRSTRTQPEGVPQ